MALLKDEGLRGFASQPTRTVSKADALASRHLAAAVSTERALLSTINHPFVPRLVGAYQTRTQLHLLTELCPGGDLHSLIRTSKKLDADGTRTRGPTPTPWRAQPAAPCPLA